MQRREKWRRGLIAKLKVGEFANPRCDGERTNMLVNDGIAWLRTGTHREGGEFYFVVVAYSDPLRAWTYRLCYGGSLHNVLAKWTDD